MRVSNASQNANLHWKRRLIYPVKQIEQLAEETDLSINKIKERVKNKTSRAVEGEIVQRVRNLQ